MNTCCPHQQGMSMLRMQAAGYSATSKTSIRLHCIKFPMTTIFSKLSFLCEHWICKYYLSTWPGCDTDLLPPSALLRTSRATPPHAYIYLHSWIGISGVILIESFHTKVLQQSPLPCMKYVLSMSSQQYQGMHASYCRYCYQVYRYSVRTKNVEMTA